MKIIRFVSTSLLLLLFGIAAPLYAFPQGDKQQEDKNKQQPPTKKEEPPRQQPPQQQRQQPPAKQPQQPKQEQPKQQSQPQSRQQPAKTTGTSTRPQQTYGGAYHGGVQYTAPTNAGVHPSGVPQHAGQVKSGFAQSRASSWSNDHKSWRDRGGYNGYRIPDNRFSLYFGREHYFRIGSLPILFVGGFPRFQYDGYWITFVDPWPENWSPDWYLNDDIYLDYTDDGYYLYDRNYPGIGIAVTISN